MPAELAREEERALLRALLEEPAMIREMARTHPPLWFTDAANLLIMRALASCLFRRDRLVVDDVVQALADHGVLDLAGGRPAVLAVLKPNPYVVAARAEIEAVRGRLRLVDAEPVVLAAARLFGATKVGSAELPPA
jgi:hypothetical protein